MSLQVLVLLQNQLEGSVFLARVGALVKTNMRMGVFVGVGALAKQI